jgi:hypothetical protein
MCLHFVVQVVSSTELREITNFLDIISRPNRRLQSVSVIMQKLLCCAQSTELVIISGPEIAPL